MLCLENLPQHLKKRGEGKKKGKGKWEEKDAHGREENIFKCAGEGFQQYHVLETFPSTLKMRGREEKRGEIGRKICAGKGREYFQMCWGRFSLKTFPSTLKMSEREEKDGEGKKNKRGEGLIFKAEIFQIAYLTTCTFQNASASGGKPNDPN